ncbi:hypothetical protein HU200_002496 [Digitaria exilis]|uniref:DUF4220 domain-containing protein n=1 Tax=Digitaria exilis TaxID=1010633 RepID=A0A835FWZ4_9POAL|nr:hypothetical protein HU200_002496 [Digitaria exilis]
MTSGIWSAMRVLVMASLLIQWFLLLAAPCRKYTIRKPAPAPHLACLHRCERPGHLRPRHPLQPSLEVLWAPVLLIHLGGREEITAYNIEDNEMWTRHTGDARVSQVSVALYAFYKTWPNEGDPPTALVGEAMALRRASINRSSPSTPRSPPYLFTELDFGGETIVHALKKKTGSKFQLSEGDKVQMILSDLSLGVAANAAKNSGRPGAEKNMKRWLRHAFRAHLHQGQRGVHAGVPGLPRPPRAVDARHGHRPLRDKPQERVRAVQRTDVKMTYVILSFTRCSTCLGCPSASSYPALCETLPSDNLIQAVQKVKNPRTGRLIKWAASIGYNGRFFHHDDRNNLYGKVAGFVVLGLDLATYRDTNREEKLGSQEAGGAVNEGYKTADPNTICRSTRASSGGTSPPTSAAASARHPRAGSHHLHLQQMCGRDLNYMAHLLNLPARHADDRQPAAPVQRGSPDQDSMGRVVWRSIEDAEDAQAWRLAKELVDIGDDKTRWELMYGCGMCRGYQHAKSRSAKAASSSPSYGSSSRSRGPRHWLTSFRCRMMKKTP